MARAFFSDLSYHPAIYDGENKRIIIEEPKMFLIVEIKDRINTQLKIFDIYDEVCQAWQNDYSFDNKTILREIKTGLQNKTFVINEDMSLDRHHLNAVLLNYFAFEYNPCKITLKHATA